MSEGADAGNGTAEAIERAVSVIDGVSGLHGGVFGEIATYLPGGRVNGVRLTDSGGEVHVILDIGHDLRAVAEHVSQVASEIAGKPIDVTVEDVNFAPGGEPDSAGRQQLSAQDCTTEVKDDG
ncbi:hypothetical protein ABLE92_23415 [Gordonia sp. VNQ95]|uniref:hypothetical protein n=1 Tax=Gordonia sp. VNQ95 TaxID=3156619 RepID=UPI0032B521ED